MSIDPIHLLTPLLDDSQSEGGDTQTDNGSKSGRGGTVEKPKES